MEFYQIHYEVNWKRACWVLDLWKQAESNTITPKPLTDYGWMVVEGKLSVEWDSPSNMDEVQERVAGLLKGCGCKTGCQTRQCGCRAKGKACGEGCNCLNCTNTGPQAMSQYTSNTEFASLEEIMEESIPEDMDELMAGFSVKMQTLLLNRMKKLKMTTTNSVFLHTHHPVYTHHHFSYVASMYITTSLTVTPHCVHILINFVRIVLVQSSTTQNSKH